MRDRDADFRLLVAYLLNHGMTVSVMPADTYIRVEEIDTAKVLSIVEYPGAFDEEEDEYREDARHYARGLLEGLQEFLRTCSVG